MPEPQPRGSSEPPLSNDALEPSLALATALLRSPSEALRADLEGGRVAGVLADVAAAIDVPLAAALRDPPGWDTLRQRYVSLFVSRSGGVPAPPYAGLAFDPELMGPSVLRLKRELAALGLDVDGGWHEPPDHVAGLAEGAALLCEAGRRGEAMGLVRGWLLPWLDRYQEPLRAADEDGFYGELVGLLRLALREVAG